MLTRTFRRFWRGTRPVAALVLGVVGGVWGVTGVTRSTSAQTWSQFHVPLPMIERCVLTDVEGVIGQIAYDPKSELLYFAAPRNNTINALDYNPRNMKTAQVVTDAGEPHGMLFLSDLRLLAAACGDGKVRLYNANEKGMLSFDKAVEYAGEADALAYDQAARRVYVGVGDLLAWFDPATGKKIGQVDVGGRPGGDGIVLEQDSSGGGQRVFVTVPGKNAIVVVNRATGKIEATWTLKDAGEPRAMSYDAAHGRLFVAAQSAKQLVVLDVKDGREITRLPITDDAFDVWYDPPGKRVYVSAGGDGGKVFIIKQDIDAGSEKYTVDHVESTAAGAATSLLIREKHQLAVATPKLAENPTFVFIYVLPP